MTVAAPYAPATITQTGDTIEVLFSEGVSAIAPGQAAVFYEGNDVIGGGWIMKSFRQGDTRWTPAAEAALV